MARWFWVSNSGDFTSLTSWNSASDGSGTTPGAVLSGSGTVNVDIIDGDELVFNQGSQSVTSNHTGHTARNVTIRGTDEYRGDVATSSTGLDVGLDGLYWACRSPLAHFSGAAEANAVIEIQRTGPASQAFIFSGTIAASGAKLRINGGNVYFSNPATIVADFVQNGGNVTDVVGVQWRAPVWSGGVFSSQNTPRDSSLSSGSYPRAKQYGGEVILRGGLRSGTYDDFHLEMYGGTCRYRGAASIVDYRLANNAVFNTENNPYGLSIGQSTDGNDDGAFVDVFPTATLKLLHTGDVIDFPNGVNIESAGSTGATGGIEVFSQSNVTGLAL